MAEDIDIKVSVIVSAKDCGKYIGELLEDLHRQCLLEFEILIVYDRSNDGTYEVIQAANEKDSRIHIISGAEAGPGRARNIGMGAARGKYLLFLDGDDRIASDMLWTMYHAAEEDAADICLCTSVEFKDKRRCRKLWDAIDLKHLPCGVHSSKECPAFFFQSFNGWAWDKLFNSQFCKKQGIRFGDNYMLEDGRFVLPAMALAERITVLDRTLIAHRKWGGSLEASRNNQNEHWRNVLDNTYDIAEVLRRAGCYDMLKRSFQNWLLNYSLWVLGRVDGEEQREMCAELLQSFWPTFGLQDLRNEDFYNPRNRYLYRRLAKAQECQRERDMSRSKTKIVGQTLQFVYRLKKHGFTAMMEHLMWRGGKRSFFEEGHFYDIQGT